MCDGMQLSVIDKYICIILTLTFYHSSALNSAYIIIIISIINVIH